jgi:L,D-transpeptidase ErfK/SrfK
MCICNFFHFNAKIKSILFCLTLILSTGSVIYGSTAAAETFPIPPDNDDLIGSIYKVKVKAGDSITTIRQRHEVSIDELTEANPGVNFNKLIIGQYIIIPGQHILPSVRTGIVINTAELRLYFFTPDGRYVKTFPVGLGRMNWRTPTTVTKVISKEFEPTWIPPKSIKAYMYARHGIVLPDVVPPGPDNPLGEYALFLAKTGYLIHGTNQEESVGTFASSGCMRINAGNIKTLYEEVSVGTPVTIIHHPVKAGWRKNVLYLESHVPVRGYEKKTELNSEDAATAIGRETLNKPANFDWQSVEEVIHQHTGLPTPIGG